MCPLVNSRSLKPVLKSIQRHVCMHYPKVMEVMTWWPPLRSEAWKWWMLCVPPIPRAGSPQGPWEGLQGWMPAPRCHSPSLTDAHRGPLHLSRSLSISLLHDGLSSQAKYLQGLPGGSAVKNLPAVQETSVGSLDQEDPLEEEMATHSSVLAQEIPWTEEPGRLQSMGLDTT